MRWYLDKPLKDERRYFQSHKAAFRDATSRVDALKEYWVAKHWLSDRVRSKIIDFLEECSSSFNKFPPNINFHVILVALVYFYWIESLPNPREEIRFWRGHSKTDWKHTANVMRGAAREIKHSIVPLLRYWLNPQEIPEWLKIVNRLDGIQPMLGLLHRPKWPFQIGKLNSLGFSPAGKIPDPKERKLVLYLISYFKDSTGKMGYEWVAEIMTAVLRKNIDKQNVLRRWKQVYDNDCLIRHPYNEKQTRTQSEIEHWNAVLEQVGCRKDTGLRKSLPFGAEVL